MVLGWTSRLLAFIVVKRAAYTVDGCQVLPALGDVPSEAALNLVIHHLRRGQLHPQGTD